jgi:DNA-binding transcriptional LysR family regulator
MLDLQHLRTFVVMAATANFTRAAKELGCSQATVTLHIKTLERELGALLFERNRFSKTNVLTAVGKTAFDYSIRLLALADEMKAAVRIW